MKELALTFNQYDEALRQNRLLGLKCAKCAAVTAPPRAACSACGWNELETVELSGAGHIVSFTDIFVAPEGREHDTPYTVVLVKLDEDVPHRAPGYALPGQDRYGGDRQAGEPGSFCLCRGQILGRHGGAPCSSWNSYILPLPR